MAEVKWIKIVTDIFDDEKILLIENMPEADGIIVIWFKLLCLAGKNNNKGVFTLNDKIAYTDEMLATIFRRPLNTVRLALKTFERYGMIEIVEGVITIPNWSKHQTLDQIENRREYQRKYMAKKREEQKMLVESKTNCEPNCKTNVRPIEREVEGEEEREVDKEEDKNKKYIEWEKILVIWNDLPSPIKPIKAITERRKDKVKARVNSLSLTIEDIIQAINNIKRSTFLQGKNGKQWIVDFDWIFKNDTNFTKVLEGRYNDKEDNYGKTDKSADEPESEGQGITI